MQAITLAACLVNVGVSGETPVKGFPKGGGVQCAYGLPPGLGKQIEFSGVDTTGNNRNLFCKILEDFKFR